MEYDAITLDTNVFHRNGLHLEGGLLAQLKQFKDGSAQFILSEIVLREVHKYILEKTKNTSDDFKRHARKVAEVGLLTDGSKKIVYDIANSVIEPIVATNARLDVFLADGGTEIVPANTTDISALIKAYFDVTPPFEGAGKKKSEFPDAIALLSLEAWAQLHSKRILAISHDTGWKDFAKKSKWIDVSEDLPSALSKFQEHAEVALKFISSLIVEMEGGEHQDLLHEIEDYISSEISNSYPYPEASSSFYYESEAAQLEMAHFSFGPSDQEPSVDIVQIGKGRIVARIGIDVSARATSEFSFQVVDGIDKDYVSIGDCSAEVEVEFKAGILLTLEGDFSDTKNDNFFVQQVELINMIDTVEFGEVGPDYGEEY
jgi:hypothetical protein